MVFIVYYKRIGMSLIHPLCDLCGNQHHFTDDGFQYLDCYWYYRSRDTKLGKRKEPIVEIWNKEKKEWVKKSQTLL